MREFLDSLRELIFSEELHSMEFGSYMEQMCAHLRIDFDVNKCDTVS